VAVIKFLNIPSGWTVSVNHSNYTFTITAPATINNSNKEGEAIILVSDNDKNTIMRIINFNANSNIQNEEGYITIDGYSGNTITIYYTDNTLETINKNADNIFVTPVNNKIINNIVLEGGVTIIAGREADGSVISLKIAGGNLVFRNAVEGYIPIGTYSEFQLINKALSGSYRQEANLDLLNIEWTPIGRSSSPYFNGTFEGNNYTIANLKISGNNNTIGLFGQSNSGTIRNVHVISGTVFGTRSVGGICGYNIYGSISGCSNASLVFGEAEVGGICGESLGSSSSIKNCYNTGAVLGSDRFIGGICGDASSPITACYNTGSISGISTIIGGICGTVHSSPITACYNTGAISGRNDVGGICGSNGSYSTITACYSIGSVSGSNDNVGGVCGTIYSYATITACYWKDITNDKADYGIGISQSNTGATKFAANAWPISGTHQQWGIGDGSGDGKYWKSLGSWNGGNSIYPKLWFEE
jgi:hypothetical protein